MHRLAMPLCGKIEHAKHRLSSSTMAIDDRPDGGDDEASTKESIGLDLILPTFARDRGSTYETPLRTRARDGAVHGRHETAEAPAAQAVCHRGHEKLNCKKNVCNRVDRVVASRHGMFERRDWKTKQRTNLQCAVIEPSDWLDSHP